MVDQATRKRHSRARIVVGETTQTIGDKTISVVKGCRLETEQINAHAVVCHLCRQVVPPIHFLYRPISNGDAYAAPGCAIRYEGTRFNQAALIEMEFAARDVADGEVRGIDWREVTTQGLKENQFEPVVMRFPIGRYCVHVTSVVPPLVQVAMCSLVLREAYGRQRLCRGCRVYHWELPGCCGHPRKTAGRKNEWQEYDRAAQFEVKCTVPRASSTCGALPFFHGLSPSLASLSGSSSIACAVNAFDSRAPAYSLRAGG